MKVILRQDIPDLGEAGQTIDVKTGYGRNYLIPRNLAIAATKGNLRAIGEIDKQNQIRERKKLRDAEQVKIRMEKLSLTSEVLVGEEDKIFGSVTSQNVVDLLANEGFAVDKKDVNLEEPIKSLGVYTVPIKIEKDIVANVKLWVIRKA
ncbi:MAG: 50S ribosomal protein L9 [Candidatus Zixiibacteriota bacterium]|nr:MAG: 50S ribosomal protein L9 [candidate division Zixibacteria bacterium]HDL04167.1 50S ribosomal protein L9 [candidate division Zixibacteria bacterium]